MTHNAHIDRDELHRLISNLEQAVTEYAQQASYLRVRQTGAKYDAMQEAKRLIYAHVYAAPETDEVKKLRSLRKIMDDPRHIHTVDAEGHRILAKVLDAEIARQKELAKVPF